MCSLAQVRLVRVLSSSAGLPEPTEEAHSYRELEAQARVCVCLHSIAIYSRGQRSYAAEVVRARRSAVQFACARYSMYGRTTTSIRRFSTGRGRTDGSHFASHRPPLMIHATNSRASSSQPRCENRSPIPRLPAY